MAVKTTIENKRIGDTLEIRYVSSANLQCVISNPSMMHLSIYPSLKLASQYVCSIFC